MSTETYGGRSMDFSHGGRRDGNRIAMARLADARDDAEAAVDLLRAVRLWRAVIAP